MRQLSLCQLSLRLVPVLLMTLVGCASLPPVRPQLPAPKLLPAEMPAFSVNQRLTVVRRPAVASGQPELTDASHSLDALLEVDAASLRLAAFALGQRVLAISWDGKALNQTRHPMLPAEVDGSHVLRDVQWAYAPTDVLRKQLPPGWELLDESGRRTLSQQGVVQLLIQYSGEPHWQGRTLLENRLEGYQLIIESELAP